MARSQIIFLFLVLLNFVLRFFFDLFYSKRKVFLVNIFENSFLFANFLTVELEIL